MVSRRYDLHVKMEYLVTGFKGLCTIKEAKVQVNISDIQAKHLVIGNNLLGTYQLVLHIL